MAIEKIQLPNGQTYEVSEWLHWPQYSSGEGEGGINPVAPDFLGNGHAINMSLFTYTVSQQLPRAGAVVPRQATESDTNQVVSSRMNYDEAFLCYSTTYEIFSLDTASDPNGRGTPVVGLPDNFQGAGPAFIGSNLRRMQRDCIFELRVGAKISKPQLRAPMSYFGQGVGAVAFGPGDALSAPPATINMDYGTGGAISPRNQRAYTLPVFIASDRVMKGIFSSPNGEIEGLNQSWRIRWYLDGLKRRPIA
jgi:hypothetical protein